MGPQDDLRGGALELSPATAAHYVYPLAATVINLFIQTLKSGVANEAQRYVIHVSTIFINAHCVLPTHSISLLNAPAAHVGGRGDSDEAGR